MVMDAAMSPVHYRLLSEHFQACLELSDHEREAYLRGEKVGDATLREELRALLKHHTPAPRTATATEVQPPRASQVHPLLPFLVLGISSLLLTVGFRAWTLGTMEDSLKQESLRTLEFLRDSRISAIRSWADRKKAEARSVLEDPSLVAHIGVLVETAQGSDEISDALHASPSSTTVFRRMTQLPAGLGEAGYCLFNPAGIVLSSDREALVGQPLSLATAAYLRSLASGEWVGSRPCPDRELGLQLEPGVARPVMYVGGPIRGSKGHVLAFGFCFFLPQREFNGLLSAPANAELVTFDDKGLRDRAPVLSASTWLPEMELGVAAERERSDVLAHLQPLRSAFSFLLAIPATLMGVLFFSFHRRRLRTSPGPGIRYGFYVVDRSIGQGGMGEVFLANHTVLGRPAALKILRETRPSPATIARFRREARLAGRLAHPNSIQVFDYGETPDGRLYYAMEYVDGLNLAQLLTLEGQLPVGRSIYLLRQIAGALEEAHSLGLLHRDLKPSNIMVGRKGGFGDVVKILDFGIASSVSDAAEDRSSLAGTPAYIAPERIRRPDQLDFRSDVYSFGGVAFQMLTGRSIFE